MNGIVQHERSRVQSPTVLAWMLATVASAVWLHQALARYRTVHNETFDLAFYARMAWGMVHGQPWISILDAHIWGLHISPVLFPLGAVGLIAGTVPSLLVAQALFALGAFWPLSRFAARRVGRLGAPLAAAIWFLYPNLSHSLTQEFHPGTLAVLPLCMCLDSLDEGRAKYFLWSCLGVLACREDFALLTALLGFQAARQPNDQLSRIGKRVLVGSLLYLAFFLFVLHPIFSPQSGSMHLHFGRWGGGPTGFLQMLLTQPRIILAHLGATERVLYPVTLLWPLVGLPLLGWRWLVHALPLFCINVISHFPGTLQLDSHYLTAMMPGLCFAAVEGCQRVNQRINVPLLSATALVAAGLIAHAQLAATVGAGGYERAAFAWDECTRARTRLLSIVPPRVSVQAPDPALAHLAERKEVFRAPPPDRGTEYVILNARHRQRYARRETLLRTEEEPDVRGWLARDDYGAPTQEGTWILLQKGASPRAGDARRYFLPRGVYRPAVPMTRCLSIERAHLHRRSLQLVLAASGRCPADLAVRIGSLRRAKRVDLLFDGLLSPAHLRKGDRLRSRHVLSEQERALILEKGLRVGLLRSSGAKTMHGDPVSVLVPLTLSD